MQRSNRWIIVVLILGSLLLSACAKAPAAATKVSPSKVEAIEGSEFKRVTVTEKAAQRLDIQTVLVRDMEIDGAKRLVVPYAAVLYGLKGETWAYTNPEPLVFVRQPINIDHIEGDLAVLLDGPAIGTAVVTVGGAELYGAEVGVSK